LSRLFDPVRDAVIIIMQRTHEDDLCGYLMEKELAGTGEKWRKIILPAIATETDQHRKEGEPLQKNRYPLEALKALKLSLGPANFSSQYQQEPVNKESREFQSEWFRYYDELDERKRYRFFTAVDPAFSKREGADDSAIVTVAFDGEVCNVVEVTTGHFDPAQLENEIIRYCKIHRPEKVGVEAIQAQQVIAYSLKARLLKEGMPITVEEIRTTTDKNMRIRKLIPLYARGLVKHRKGSSWSEKLEAQLLKFPRGKHDDVVNAVAGSLLMAGVRGKRVIQKQESQAAWTPAQRWRDMTKPGQYVTPACAASNPYARGSSTPSPLGPTGSRKVY
jgi:predicted phage terminase large subunit-like protein